MPEDFALPIDPGPAAPLIIDPHVAVGMICIGLAVIVLYFVFIQLAIEGRRK